jgi:CrcB protein
MTPDSNRVFLVAVGGLIGCVARYWLSGVVQRLGDHGFPSGTLAVNVIGSIAIGVVMTLSLERGFVDESLRILLTTGFCGGFTTMSTFSYETFVLLQDGEHLFAIANAGVTFAACLGAVWLGSIIARAL